MLPMPMARIGFTTLCSYTEGKAGRPQKGQETGSMRMDEEEAGGETEKRAKSKTF